jgi:hypothetical protein
MMRQISELRREERRREQRPAECEPASAYSESIISIEKKLNF